MAQPGRQQGSAVCRHGAGNGDEVGTAGGFAAGDHPVGRSERHGTFASGAQFPAIRPGILGFGRHLAPASFQCRVRRRRLCGGSGDARRGHAGAAQRDLRAQRRARLHQPRARQHGHAHRDRLSLGGRALGQQRIFYRLPRAAGIFYHRAAPPRSSLSHPHHRRQPGLVGHQPRRFGSLAPPACPKRYSLLCPSDRRTRL